MRAVAPGTCEGTLRADHTLAPDRPCLGDAAVAHRREHRCDAVDRKVREFEHVLCGAGVEQFARTEGDDVEMTPHCVEFGFWQAIEKKVAAGVAYNCHEGPKCRSGLKTDNQRVGHHGQRGR